MEKKEEKKIKKSTREERGDFAHMNLAPVPKLAHVPKLGGENVVFFGICRIGRQI